MWDSIYGDPEPKTIWTCVSITWNKGLRDSHLTGHFGVCAKPTTRKPIHLVALAIPQNATDAKLGPKMGFSAWIFVAQQNIGVFCLCHLIAGYA